jgi:hypothetical protein
MSQLTVQFEWLFQFDQTNVVVQGFIDEVLVLDKTSPLRYHFIGTRNFGGTRIDGG